MRKVLRGATLVDGTGAPARRADVEVVDGRIGRVGEIERGDGEEVDLSGLVLCPGFVDIHTHLDAQVFWDPDLTPSSWHGVTTVVQGNCGFGIAPARPGDRELIMETLELVEGMNVHTLRAGIDWGFETFPEYLDARASPAQADQRGPDRPPQHGAAVRHGRRRRLLPCAPPTTSVEAIRDAMLEALDAGAIGISTSQAPSHQGPYGRPVPSRFADRARSRRSLEALADARAGDHRDHLRPSTRSRTSPALQGVRRADHLGLGHSRPLRRSGVGHGDA